MTILNESECENLCRTRNCETIMVRTTPTDDNRFNEFELRATLFGSRRMSSDMWARDDVTRAVIACGPGPVMETELNASANATVMSRCAVIAKPIASEVSSNEIEFRLKSNATMNATSAAVKLESSAATKPNVTLKLSIIDIDHAALVQFATVQEIERTNTTEELNQSEVIIKVLLLE